MHSLIKVSENNKELILIPKSCQFVLEDWLLYMYGKSLLFDKDVKLNKDRTVLSITDRNNNKIKYIIRNENN